MRIEVTSEQHKGGIFSRAGKQGKCSWACRRMGFEGQESAVWTMRVIAGEAEAEQPLRGAAETTFGDRPFMA